MIYTTSAHAVCKDPFSKFNAQKGYCECIGNRIKMGSHRRCVKCPDGTTAVPEKNICLECEKTQYVKNGECVPRTQISKWQMYECYPNTDSTKFAQCVRSNCESGNTVKCISQDGNLGEKKCGTDGKWGECNKQNKKQIQLQKPMFQQVPTWQTSVSYMKEPAAQPTFKIF